MEQTPDDTPPATLGTNTSENAQVNQAIDQVRKDFDEAYKTKDDFNPFNK